MMSRISRAAPAALAIGTRPASSRSALRGRTFRAKKIPRGSSQPSSCKEFSVLTRNRMQATADMPWL
jgi:hypothetical protein